MGYNAVVNGAPINYAGGTSVAAPIWAAILARANQARRAAGRPRLGFVNPLLYRLASTVGENAPFRAIDIGDNDVELQVIDADENVTTYVLEGYRAAPGWDPVSGLGVPRVRQLIDALVASPAARPVIPPAG